MGDQELTPAESGEALASLRAEIAELQEKQERTEAALSAGAIRFWVSDLVTRRITFSETGSNLLGLDEHTNELTIDEWLSRIHPDDREKVLSATEDAKRSGDEYSCQYRITLPDQSIRWISSKAAVIRDAQGGALQFIGVSSDVSDHMKVANELRESEHRFRELAESAKEVFWMHDVREGMQLLYVSPPYETVWGRRLEDIYKNPEDWLDAIHEDDRDRVIDVFGQAVKMEQDYDAEFRIKRPDGTVRWIHDRGHPVRDESGRMYRFAGLAEDVTEKKAIEVVLSHHREELESQVSQRTEELNRRNEELKVEIQERQKIEASLRESEDRLRALFEGIDDGILVHDEEGRILDCNSAVCRRLKYTREELLTLSTSDIDEPAFGSQFKERLAIQLQGGSLRVEGIHLDRDGNPINVDCLTSMIEFEGMRVIHVAIRDITEIKEAEETRHKLEQQMQHSQKLESLGVLAGGIAHDFNNLLLGMLGNAELARDNLATDSPAYQDLMCIEQAAKRAADLCRQMLAYAGKGRFVV